MKKNHYLGFKALVGEQIRYVALIKGSPRNRWIGWSAEQRTKRLCFVVNNNRYPNVWILTVS